MFDPKREEGPIRWPAGPAAATPDGATTARPDRLDPLVILVAVVLVAGWLPLTELGVVSTIAFTVATLGFAYAQYLGVRRLA